MNLMDIYESLSDAELQAERIALDAEMDQVSMKKICLRSVMYQRELKAMGHAATMERAAKEASAKQAQAMKEAFATSTKKSGD